MNANVQVVLFSIVDHHMRARASDKLRGSSAASASSLVPPPSYSRACGMLFGVQSGQRVEIFSAIEMLVGFDSKGLPLITSEHVVREKETGSSLTSRGISRSLVLR